MKTDYPRFGSVEDQAGFLGMLQREIAEITDKPGLILGCLQEQLCFSEARTHFALPWEIDVRTIFDSQEREIVWRLRFPGIHLLKHVESEDAVEIILDGRPVRFGGNTALVLEWLFDRPVSTVGDAIAGCSALMRWEEVVESLIELMNRDVLVLR
jgi:hypothetical protein